MSDLRIDLSFAPEFIEDEKTFSSNVYSFAIILYQLFSFNFKFVGKHHSHYNNFRNRERLERPENIPDSYWNLINQCWAHDPEVRPTFEEIVERLKSDEFVIEEFGMKTDLDQIHDYQNRIENSN